MHGCMDAWMHGWMDGWMDGWMHGCMNGCTDAWMHGCMDGCRAKLHSEVTRKKTNVARFCNLRNEIYLYIAVRHAHRNMHLRLTLQCCHLAGKYVW